jgi:hypothetical protein
MIFGLFILAVALSISAVAAYYSIAGLTAIFAAAVMPIIIMGAVLEVGKIAATVWLHKFWPRANIQFKLYLVPAILVLMLITSMGIFGFLSKAHMDQNISVGDSAAQVAILDEKIKTEQDNIKSQRDNIQTAKTAIQQMNAQVDQLLGRTDDDRGANRAVQVRKQQARERKNLQNDIAQSQKEIETINSRIAELNQQRAPIAAESRKIEAEVGPIKYIAALIYGDNPNADLLERAVRWVIILLVLVFDPLALILILAAEQTIQWSREDKNKPKEKQREGWHQEWVPDSEDPWRDMDPITEEQFDNIRKASGVDQDLEMTEHLFDTEEEFFAHGKEIAQELDAQEDQLPDNYASTQSYLHKPWTWFANNTGTQGWVPTPVRDPLDIPVIEGEEMWAQEVIDSSQYDPQPIRPVPPPATDEAPINPNPKSVQITESQIVIPDFSIGAEMSSPVNAGFGIEFPSNPAKGDMFLRTDYLPNRLYKWNDKKWIDVDKNKVDSFAYDEEYIRHLIDKIDRGEYDIELLTPAEQEQISRYLNDGKSET